MAKVTHKEKHVFKEGQKLRLDNIYDFQGIGNETIGHWWEHDGEYGFEDDNIVVTMDIEIQITIKVDEDSTE